MTVHEMAAACGLQVVHAEPDREYTGVYCCDLLSIAMAGAPMDSAWTTVMGNRNVVAVASLADVAVVILCAGQRYDEDAISAAQGTVTLLCSEEPVYETAVKIGALLK